MNHLMRQLGRWWQLSQSRKSVYESGLAELRSTAQRSNLEIWWSWTRVRKYASDHFIGFLEIRRCYEMAQEFLFLPESKGTIRPACDAAKDQGVKYYASSVGSVADTVS